MSRHQYNIEIAGNCNLRCPSCPVGNSRGDGRPRGFMDLALFEEIIAKVAAESGDETLVALYDWGEPTLNPHLMEILQLIRKHGLRSRISSNLNIDRQLEPAIRGNPDEFHISLSGFYDENYGVTHRRGRMAKVQENMRLIRTFIDRYNATTKVVVGFHVYRHNVMEDLPAMRAFARELGFTIEPVVAQIFPLEKQLAYYEREDGQPATLPHVTIEPRDEALMDILLVRPEETLAWWWGLPKMQRWWMSRDCERISKKTSVRIDGSVALCCATYDSTLAIEGSYLDLTHSEIQRRRREHPFCGPCIRHGLHLSAPGGPRQKLAEKAKKSGPKGARSYELLEINRPANEDVLALLR